MADPKILIRRSSTPNKVPTTTNLQLGELAINTFDGKLYLERDQTSGSGIATVIAVNPWNVGVGSLAYDTYFTAGNVGINTTSPTQLLDVAGDIRLRGAIYDSNNTTGTANQVLVSRAGAGITWANLTAIPVGDANTLDGLDSSQFLRSDAADTKTGITTFSDDAIFSSNVDVTGTVIAKRFETDNANNTNFFAGYQAGLTANSSSDYNVVIGYQAGYDLAGSDHNVALGYQALYDTANNNTFGNVAIGYRSLFNAEGGDYNVSIGYDTLQYLTNGHYNIAIGNRALSGNTITNNHNIGIGYNTLYALSSGFGNVATGSQSGQSVNTGSYNTLYGYQAGRDLDPSSSYNTFVGGFAGAASDAGDFIVAVGYNAGWSAEGDQSVFIGAYAGVNAVNTFGSVYVGYQAGNDSEGTYNIAMGYQAMLDGSSGGAYNIALGYQALYRDQGDRNFNIGLGYRALFGSSSGTTGDYNTALGREAGEILTSGSGNLFLGSYAGDNVTTGSNNVVIKASSSDYADIDATTNNQLWIGYDDQPWITGDTNKVELYYGTSAKLGTTGYGVTVSGGLNVSGVSTFQGNVNLGDNDRLRIGDGNDLQIYHDGSNSFIDDTGTGDLVISATHLRLRSAAAETYLLATANGSVELYYDNSKKFETTGIGVSIYNRLDVTDINASGIVTATQFVGDGSLITGLSAEVGVVTNTTNQAQIIPFALGYGATTGFGATDGLVFNPSSTRLGIGSATPAYALDVVGDINSSTDVKINGTGVLDTALALAIALG